MVIQVSNRLNRDKDLVELYKSDKATLVDSLSYGYEDAICAAGDGNTLGRLPELTGNWVRFMSATPAASNSGELLPCPLPSPSPPPSPSPSPSPSPTLAPTPTPSPPLAPSPSPKPSPKPSPITSPSPALSPFPEGTVAGETIDLSFFSASPTPSPTPSPLPKELRLRTDRAKNLLITGTGIIILSLSGYFGYRKYLDKGKIGE